MLLHAVKRLQQLTANADVFKDANDNDMDEDENVTAPHCGNTRVQETTYLPTCTSNARDATACRVSTAHCAPENTQDNCILLTTQSFFTNPSLFRPIDVLVLERRILSRDAGVSSERTSATGVICSLSHATCWRCVGRARSAARSVSADLCVRRKRFTRFGNYKVRAHYMHYFAIISMH